MTTDQPEAEFNGLVNEISIRYEPKHVPGITGITIRDPHSAVNFFAKIWNPNTLQLKESFYMAFLNNAKRVMGYYLVSSGSQTATIVDVNEVARMALLTGACSVILCHNHPSGQARESHADINLTKRIKAALDLLDIGLDDHIILCGDDYVSMRTKNLV